jgi:hypothetical protein
MMRISSEINVFGVLIAVIAFFAVAKLNDIDRKLEKIQNLEIRLTKVETKLFGENMPKENQICFPKVYAVLSFGKKKRDSEESQS